MAVEIPASPAFQDPNVIRKFDAGAATLARRRDGRITGYHTDRGTIEVGIYTEPRRDHRSRLRQGDTSPRRKRTSVTFLPNDAITANREGTVRSALKYTHENYPFPEAGGLIVLQNELVEETPLGRRASIVTMGSTFTNAAAEAGFSDRLPDGRLTEVLGRLQLPTDEQLYDLNGQLDTLVRTRVWF